MRYKTEITLKSINTETMRKRDTSNEEEARRKLLKKDDSLALEPASQYNQNSSGCNSGPELGGPGLALVKQRLLDIVGRVELGWLDGWSLGFGLGIVPGENAAVLGLDSPETTLVIHLRP